MTGILCKTYDVDVVDTMLAAAAYTARRRHSRNCCLITFSPQNILGNYLLDRFALWNQTLCFFLVFYEIWCSCFMFCEFCKSINDTFSQFKVT